MAPKKQQKMSIGAFLGDQSLGSWADEMENMPLPSSDSKTGYGRAGSSGFGSGSRPGFGERSDYGGKSDYGAGGYSIREALPMPTKPPYTAHLGNLSFDVTQADIEEFFTGCEVTNVRIVEDKLDHKPKGFGYVEFGTLDGLKKALEANGTQFEGRNVRVSVAEPPKDRGEAREISDWSRKGPLPPLPSDNQRRPSDRGGYNRGYDAGSDAGSDRGGSRRNFSLEPSDGKPRDFANWERKGPLAPTQGAAPPMSMRDAGRIKSNERTFERRHSPSWGEGRSQDGSRPPRREFQDRPPAPERVPTAAEMDNQWRSKMRPDAPVKSPTATPDASMPSSPAAPSAPALTPSVRPKLNLQKRTVSDATSSDPAQQAGVDSKASPFGAARPIDTAQREKEIEEKRLVLRLKKEEEEKEREKKRQAEKAAKAELATSPTTENGKALPKEPGNETVIENGAASPQAGKSYEILRRMTGNENGEDAEDGDPDGPANGALNEHEPVKPNELTRDIAQQADASAATPNVEPEDEGWSTVAKPTRNRKGGNQAARTIAS